MMHEVPCLDKGRPSYRWVQYYCQMWPDGCYAQPPESRKDWQKRAKVEGCKLQFHQDEQRARQAASADLPPPEPAMDSGRPVFGRNYEGDTFNED